MDLWARCICNSSSTKSTFITTIKLHVTRRLAGVSETQVRKNMTAFQFSASSAEESGYSCFWVSHSSCSLCTCYVPKCKLTANLLGWLIQHPIIQQAASFLFSKWYFVLIRSFEKNKKKNRATQHILGKKWKTCDHSQCFSFRSS